MRCLLLFILLLWNSGVAQPISSEFQSSDYTHLYHLEKPSAEEFPLVLAIGGSFVEKKGPQSILGFLEHLAPSFLSEGVGVIGLERRGVKVDGIDSKEYHLFNTPSQRLVDHIELVRYLQNHPPRGWNGQLFALGGSEGGPIAIKLASSMDLDLCVVLCGCGSQPFRDLIWAFIQRISPKFKPFLPSSREEYDQLCEWIKTHPDPEKFWLGQTYLYWSDALDQSEDREFLSLNCPAIVVAGSEDSECASTDRLIERAHQLQRNVKYLRIEGMGHEALEPRWQVLKKIIECLKECSI